MHLSDFRSRDELRQGREAGRFGVAPARRARSVKQTPIVDTAMRHFARYGYQGARMEDVAAELGIAKGSIFAHLGAKERLFLECYKKAVTSLPAYLDAPQEVTSRGFFATVRHWLDRTEHLVHEDWVPYRVALLGNYASELALKREINHWLASEDPYGTVAFVRWGLERGELRRDIRLEMIVSLLDWLMERFQDALVTDELDPGLFRRPGSRSDDISARVTEFMRVLRSAIGAT